MNKNELKRIIKPLVKECINEVLLEEGLLSNVVSEVAIGLQKNTIIETKTTKAPTNIDMKQASKKISEHKKKMLDAIGSDAYNGVDLFEGTQPIQDSQPTAGTADLGSASDSGVDISALVGNASKIWDAMK